MHTITDLSFIEFPLFSDEDASLSVYESGNGIPFEIKRMFSVHASKPCTRGFHAHKECTQLLVVVTGICKITVDDGVERKEIELFPNSTGLLIPPTIWGEQTYDAQTILMVFTDKLYDEDDYLRNYDDFLTFRKRL